MDHGIIVLILWVKFQVCIYPRKKATLVPIKIVVLKYSVCSVVCTDTYIVYICIIVHTELGVGQEDVVRGQPYSSGELCRTQGWNHLHRQ